MSQKDKSYQEDLIFINKAKKDINAFALLYDKYWEKIFRYIYSKVQSLDDTGDICQQTMMKAMANLNRYEDRGYPFSAWLYRIAGNEINLYYRKKKKNGFVEIMEKDAITLIQEINPTEGDLVAEQEKLLLILAQLKPKQAEIIEMRFFFKYSFKEIANVYQISEANAKMRLYRVIEKLKQKWKT
ncbi:MAG: RNA polymerase sigma factor [Putridiphycobacter sp.]